jgi:tetratricopeptide (TPR) repeat protein
MVVYPKSNDCLTSTEYHVPLDDITSLAIVTFKIPDISDPSKRAQLPPSQHKAAAGLMLQGCAQAKDPLAIVHVLTAVYVSTTGFDSSIKEIARLFPQPEIAKYRNILDELTLKANKFALGPDALTLKGLFLEQEGRKSKAKELYQEAILRGHLKYTPGSRHPMQIPLVTPWNALGFMLKADKDPNVQAEAKKYFEKGALEGGDPLSYYELSAFESRTSTKWLQYTSKAAASGHRQAIINLADFYQEVAEKESPVLKDSNMRKSLNWLLGWRNGSAAALAREWLQAASNIGHKPSMLQLADYHTSLGNHELAQEHLRHMLESPKAANQREEWPQLVQIARKRLAGLR